MQYGVHGTVYIYVYVCTLQQQDRVLTTDEKLQQMMQEALLLRLSLVSCRL